jgi:hypothetical protein
VVWGSLTNTLTNVAGMAGGNGFVAYQRQDGTAGTWGSNAPVTPATLSGSNAGVVGVAAGDTHVLAVRTNGTVTGWGTYAGWSPNNGTVPGLTNAVGVGAGQYHGLALKGDGTVQAWGANFQNVTNVPGELSNPNTAGFVRAVAVAASYQYTLVLRADGSVRGWGNGAPTNLPSSLSNSMATNPIVSLAVEQHHAVALQRDGTVTTWWAPGGQSNSQTLTVPGGLKGRVPMGGPDSDRDGWANEAELRVGSDPLSTNSIPVKASFGISFAYGTNASTFQTSRTMTEGTNRTVGTLEILDSMGRLENGNQPEMSVELATTNTFELVGRELRFKTNPVHDGANPAANTYSVDVIVKDSPTTAPITTTLTVNVGNVAPQITGTTSFSVEENVAIGTAVGTLQATENHVTWSITSGNGLGLLAINAQTGQITVAGPIDYEALTNKTITLQVRVTDAAGEASSGPVSVTVTDVVEDTVPPVLALNGINPMRANPNEAFTDPGATVTDNVDVQRTVYASGGTVDTAAPGTYVLTYTAADSAGNVATPVTRQVMVDGWTIPAPGAQMDPALLTSYAIGGASSPTGTPVPPAMGIQTVTDTNGTTSTVLAMTVLVRINDPLAVQAEAVASLGDFGNPAQTTVAGGAPAADQSGVPEGFQRQVFTVPANANRQFLRLKVSR